MKRWLERAYCGWKDCRIDRPRDPEKAGEKIGDLLTDENLAEEITITNTYSRRKNNWLEKKVVPFVVVKRSL
jgi:hypothetical protein